MFCVLTFSDGCRKIKVGERSNQRRWACGRYASNVRQCLHISDFGHFCHTGPLQKRRLDVPSPSKENTLLENRLAIVSFDPTPLSLPAGITNPYAVYAQQRGSDDQAYITVPSDLLRDAKFYSLLTCFIPDGVTAEVRQPQASDCRTFKLLYPHAQLHAQVNLPVQSEPEIFSKVVYGSRKSPYSAKLKSMGEQAVMFSELLVSSLVGLLESYFPTDSNKVVARFYSAPPVAFAVAGSAYIAHMMLIEWVGQLRIIPYTNPFFLASAEHGTAVAAISTLTSTQQFRNRYSDYIDLSVAEGWRSEGAVSWKTIDGVFWKIISGPRDAQGTEYCKLYRIYEKYAQVCTDGVLLPQLVPAKLLFGQFAVAVRTSAVGTRDVTSQELHEDQNVIKQVAAAIVFLCRRGLLYTDLRPPNVRCDGAKVFLVDYDDMIVCEPCTSFEALVSFTNGLDGQVTYLDSSVHMTAIRDAYQE